MWRQLLVLIRAVGLLGCCIYLLWSSRPPAWASALADDGPAPCAKYHTIVHGQTLSLLAQRYHTTVAKLMAINPGVIQNPNWIRAGITLCVESGGGAATAVLEINYQYEPTSEEAKVKIATAHGGFQGKRNRFPLAANRVNVFQSQAEMEKALRSETVAPILFGSNNGPDDPGNYTLFLTRPQTDLFGSLPLTERCSVPLQEALAVAGSVPLNDVSAQFAIEDSNGLRHLFPVTHLSFVSAFGKHEACASSLIDFALLPLSQANEQLYQIYLLHPNARLTAIEDDLTEALQPTANRVAIEITYENWELIGGDELGLLTPGTLVGKRIEYPLAPREGFQPMLGVSMLPTTTLESNPAPLFYGFREDDRTGYTLMAMGDTAVFASLLLTNSQQLTIPMNCQGVDLTQAIVSPLSPVSNLALFLEDDSGVRYPFQITRLGLVANGQNANACRSPTTVVAFAIYPAADQQYQFKILFDEESGQVGPPGARRAANCRRWRLARGLIYSLLRSWWACW